MEKSALHSSLSIRIIDIWGLAKKEKMLTKEYSSGIIGFHKERFIKVYSHGGVL
jgi:hypothetical protein